MPWPRIELASSLRLRSSNVLHGEFSLLRLSSVGRWGQESGDKESGDRRDVSRQVGLTNATAVDMKYGVHPRTI